MTVGVRITRECDVILASQTNQTRHGILGGRIHPDLTVPVDGHESKCRVYNAIDHLQIELITFSDCLPIGQTSATERIDSNVYFAIFDRFQVYYGGQIVYIRTEVVVVMGCRCSARSFRRVPAIPRADRPRSMRSPALRSIQFRHLEQLQETLTTAEPWTCYEIRALKASQNQRLRLAEQMATCVSQPRLEGMSGTFLPPINPETVTNFCFGPILLGLAPY
jgi:hypothetical protein